MAFDTGGFSGVSGFVIFCNPQSHYNVNKRNSQGLIVDFVNIRDCVQTQRVVFVFYYNYVNLCNKRGISPSAAAEDMGFKRSVVTRWSKGTQPRTATLQKIATYFDVSVDTLTDTKEPATQTGDGSLDEELIARLLLLTPEEQKQVDAFVQGLLASRSE